MTESNKVGIVAENAMDIHYLRTVVAEAGLQVGSSIEFDKWDQGELNQDVQAWILNLDVEKLEAICPEKIDALIDSIPGLMLLCEGGSPPTPADPEYLSWKRRLLSKVQEIPGTINLQGHETGVPEHVWILAGSIGGPDAIRVFMGELPPELNVAFVYANHLQSDFDAALAQSVQKNTHYPAYVASNGDILHVNQVAVISPDFTTSVKSNGTFLVSKEKWQGQYQPSLDQVIANVAKEFGKLGGVIIFSGMCDDGAASCRIMKQYGGQVWIQQPMTCISSQMPDEALATGCVDYVGTPEELAHALTNFINEQNKSKVSSL